MMITFKQLTYKPHIIMNIPNEGSEAQPTSNKNENKPAYCQWIQEGGNSFYPAVKTIEQIPAGYYTIAYDGLRSQYFLIKKEVITDKLIHLPNEQYNGILKDISEFWDKSERFKKFEFIHKRGILLYGPPGSGKTSLINLLVNQVITEQNGLVINVSNPDYYSDFIGSLRAIETSRPIIVIMEDIDEILKAYSQSNVLNILDGVLQINKVVYIATTNYPEKLEGRIKNRPSRFDRRYCIGMPNKEARHYYLSKTIPTEDLPKDLDKWVEDTDGLGISHLRELIVDVLVLGNNYETSIIDLKKMSKEISATGEITASGFAKR
jgi:GTPase SAR1 family protein